MLYILYIYNIYIYIWPRATFDVTAASPPPGVCRKVCRKVCQKGMSGGRYVGKLWRKGMSDEFAEGMSEGMSEVWGRRVRAGNVAVTWRMLAARTKLQGLTQDPPPKDRTKPQCFASRRSGLEPSREWGPGYVGGMSAVCRTRGLWVSPLFRAFSREWGLEL